MDYNHVAITTYNVKVIVSVKIGCPSIKRVSEKIMSIVAWPTEKG